MQTFTALFDRREDAEAAQARLQQLGVIDADGLGVHQEGAQNLWQGRRVAPPEPDRRLYEEGMRRGGFLLTVDVDDAYADRVHDLLEDSPAVDVEAREREYRQAGALDDRPATAVPPTGAPTPTYSRDAGEDMTIPVAHEELRVGKRQVDRGSVRVRAYVESEPVHEQVHLREEHVEVDRQPTDGAALRGRSADGVFESRTFEVSERGEEAVVGKETVVTEELRVHKDVEDRVQDIDETVRQTEVDVEDTRTGQHRHIPDAPGGPRQG